MRITKFGRLGLLGFVALVACALAARAGDINPDLVGTWEHQESGGVTLRFVLNADGSGKLAEDPITYTSTADAIEIRLGGDTIRYRYARSGDQITISGGDLDKPAVFTRSATAAPKRGLGAKLDKPAATPPPAAPEGKPAAAAAAAPASDSIVGTWKANDGTTMQFTADGKCVYNNLGTIPYKTQDGMLTLQAAADAQPIRYQVQGDRLTLTLDGEAQTLTRIDGGAGAAKAADDKKPAEKNSLVGRWNSEDGPVEFKEDGTGTLAGKPFRYKQEGQVLITTSADGKETRIPFTLDGNRMVVIVNNEIGVLTRADPAAPAGAAGEKAQAGNASGVAGVYVAQESSIDATNAMVLTQYLILYPDGTVGWNKSEMGATRQQVTENLERFNSFRTGAANNNKTYGRWESNGRDIVVQWNIWNNLTCRGQIDGSGTIHLEKMGTLNEGATLEFKRQQ
jgi:uncharacterized protein (DUF2147 family)